MRALYNTRTAQGAEGHTLHGPLAIPGLKCSQMSCAACAAVRCYGLPSVLSNEASVWLGNAAKSLPP
eukprot:1157508-Pelagomonas_calceolata.AAC.3